MGGFDAIVIGSGLGGLTAGACYAKAGHRVLVIERNASFGGAAGTYRHGSLTVEASLHETADPAAGRDGKSAVLRDLGVLDGLEFLPVGDLYEVRGAGFETPFALPHGFDAAEAALVARFPRHARAMARLLSRIRSVVELAGYEHDGLWWLLHAPTLPATVWRLVRDVRLSLADVLTQELGDDETAKLAVAANLSYFSDDPGALWWLFFAIAQGGYLGAGGTYIRGGSGMLTNRLLGVIEEHGGAAYPNRTVTEILVDSRGRAAGVRHAATTTGGDVWEERAPVMFGNAAPMVLAEALPAEVRPDFLARYADRRPSTSLFSVSLGLDRRPADYGVTHYSTILIPDWMRSLSDYARNAPLLGAPPSGRVPALGMVDYSAVDSGLNPDGPHLVSVVGLDRLANWAGLTAAEYHARRDAWRDAIVAEVDRAFPGLAGAVTQAEMATASTMRQHLNTDEGSVYGFAARPPAGMPRAGTTRAVTTTVPGLWLASSYGGFGGFTGATMTGALAARAALRAGDGH